MMQRSCPAIAISSGGSSVIAANDSKSGSPLPVQCDHRQAASVETWSRYLRVMYMMTSTRSSGGLEPNIIGVLAMSKPDAANHGCCRNN